MKKYQDTGILLLRLSMAATFLSAVASRLSMWGSESSGWSGFVGYTADVLSFAPTAMVPAFAIASTLLEIGLSVLLVIGYQTKWAALGAALLTFMFAIAMAYSFGVKSPLDYSVFVDCAACLLLASFPNYRWSVDEYLSK